MDSSINLKADRGDGVIGILAGMMVFVILSITLRFWSRLLTAHSSGRSPFWWDDWFALIAVPFAIVEYALGFVSVKSDGLGRHVEAITPAQLEGDLKLLFVGQLLENASLFAARISVLFFYLRIVTGIRHQIIVHSIHVAMLLSTLYFLAFVLLGIFSCNPIKKNWMPEVPGHCLPQTTWWLWFAVISVFLDLLILLIPMPMLWNLNLKSWRKVGVMIIFASGYCCLATAIGRLVSVHLARNNLDLDPTFNSIEITYWIIVEPALAIFSVSLPSIFPLLKRGIHYGPLSLFSLKSIPESYSGPKSTPRFGNTRRGDTSDNTVLNASFERLHDGLVPDGSNREYIAMVGRDSKVGSVENMELSNSINVTRDVVVSKVGMDPHVT